MISSKHIFSRELFLHRDDLIADQISFYNYNRQHILRIHLGELDKLDLAAARCRRRNHGSIVGADRQGLCDLLQEIFQLVLLRGQEVPHIQKLFALILQFLTLAAEHVIDIETVARIRGAEVCG